MCRVYIIFLLVSILVPIGVSDTSVLNPVKAMQAARLFACKALGYDGGVNKAYQSILLSVDDERYTRQCLLGCDLATFFTGNFLLEFETKLKPLSKLGGPVYRRLFFYTQQCIKVSMLSQEKCSLVRSLPFCLLHTYKNYLIRKFIPWWPGLKSTLNQIINFIPPLRRFRDWLRKQVYDWLRKLLTNSNVSPIFKWLSSQLRNGLLSSVIKNVISSIIILLSKLTIPPPFSEIIPIIIKALRLLLSF